MSEASHFFPYELASRLQLQTQKRDTYNQREKGSMRKHNLRLILFICSIASLSGVILGYDASVISGVIDPLTEHLNLSPWESGWAVSNVILGCVLGA